MIRFALEKDINDIYELGRILNSNFKRTYNLNSYIKNSNYVILVNEDDKINAFLIMYKNLDYYELEAIVVDSTARCKNIATNLLRFFINNFTQTGEVILLEVAVNNENALKLYKKFDFKIVNTRKNYYDKVDAYVLKKVI